MMKNYLTYRLSYWRIFTFAFILSFSSSCDEEYDNIPSSITGYYKIESLTANQPVDLINDGKLSTDIIDQIYAYSGTLQYDFNSKSTYLEITPNRYNHKAGQMINVPFPDPDLTNIYTHSPIAAVSYKNRGLNKDGYEYIYDKSTKSIIIDRTIVDESKEEKWGKIVSLRLIGNGKLELIVSKNYFDFFTNRWLRLEVTCIYTKYLNQQ